MPPTAAGNPRAGPGARTAIQLRPWATGQTRPGPGNPHRVTAGIGWTALAAMAVTQVVSSRAGHLEIFVSLIVVLLAVASVSFTALGPGWPRLNFFNSPSANVVPHALPSSPPLTIIGRPFPANMNKIIGNTFVVLKIER